MIKLSRLLKDYEDSGAFNALVSVCAAVDSHTLITKTGDVLCVLKAAGVDGECLDPSEIEAIVRRFEGSLRLFDENFRLYQYMIKRSHPQIPHARYEDPVAQEAVENRFAYLERKAATLYVIDIYFVIAYEGWHTEAKAALTLKNIKRNPRFWLGQLLSTEKRITVLQEDLDRACEVLANKVNSFVVQLRDSIGIELLDKQQTFCFLRQLLNYSPHKYNGVKLQYDEFIDFQACGSSLECYRDHLCLDNYYVQVLTLKELPAQTVPYLLKGLQDIGCQCVIATEWRRETNAIARRLIQSKRRHFHNSKASLLNYLGSSETATKDMLIDNAATALVSELGRGLEEMDVKGNFFGEFSLTVIVYDDDRARLKRAVADCFKFFASAGAQLMEERPNLLNAFLAVLPGNRLFNLRKMWVTNVNYADLSLLFKPQVGETRNEHLGAEYLAVLETSHGTPYFFNLHHKDNAHTLILGATGSGKSFLLNFLLTHLQKYQPRTYIFDLGGSYENLTRLFGGTYVPVGVERRLFTINPFSLAPTPENLQFLFSFVRVLTESGGYKMSAQEERDLYEQIENLYAIDPAQRRLFTLANIVNRPVRERLQRWVKGGQYGAWFDNTEDNLTFAPFQTLEFEGMDKAADILEPLLFYVLHRANESIYKPELATTLKIFVMDEAWRFMRHPTIKSYIVEALKTWRKKNAAMILATQSGEDLLASDMLPVISESCATKMFLANPWMDRSSYRQLFHLNEKEADLISGLVPKQQILLKRPDVSKIVNLNVDRKGYWLYTNNPYDNQRKREAFERHGFEEGLEILARSNAS